MASNRHASTAAIIRLPRLSPYLPLRVLSLLVVSMAAALLISICAPAAASEVRPPRPLSPRPNPQLSSPRPLSLSPKPPPILRPSPRQPSPRPSSRPPSPRPPLQQPQAARPKPPFGPTSRRDAPPSPAAPSPRMLANYTGIRLVIDGQVLNDFSPLGVIGQLQVKVVEGSVPGIFTLGYQENDGWALVCDDGSLSVDRAQDFCRLLGYKYGLKFYGGPDFNAMNPRGPWPIGELICGSIDNIQQYHWNSSRRSAAGFIDFPPRLNQPPCLVYDAGCPRRQLVALQCSESRIIARPLPPTPPGTPPPPPSMGHAIKLPYVELNLISEPGAPASGYDINRMRVELLVTAADGTLVWAPLCALPAANYSGNATADGETLARISSAAKSIADTSCFQWQNHSTVPVQLAFGMPRPAVTFSTPLGYSTRLPPPSTSTGSQQFDPSAYSHWVTVVGGHDRNRYSMQEMQLGVSTAPCAGNRLFSLRCTMLVS